MRGGKKTGEAVVIAIGNLKGGTGKSTIAVNLACALAAAGRPTIVIDADPQLTASQWLRRAGMPAGLHEAAPADPLTPPAWRHELRAIGTGQAFVIIDLPAAPGTPLAAALLVADLVLIPTAAAGPALAATHRMLQRVVRVQDEQRAGCGPACLVVPTPEAGFWCGDGGLRRLRQRLPVPLAPPIRHSPHFARAFDAAQWIGAFAPYSRAHRDIRRLMRQVVDTLAAAAPRDSLADRPLPLVRAAGLVT